MEKIEIVSNINPEEFRNKFVAGRKPAIIKDAIEGWQANKKWTADFWKKKYGDKQVDLEDKVYTLKEIIDLALNSDENLPAPYYRNINIAREYPELISDISPESEFCLPNKFHHQLFKILKSSFMVYGQYELFIGGKGRSFPYLHYDVPGADTFIHQITGIKDLILFSPEDSQYLYPKGGAAFNISDIPDIENVSGKDFPLFKNAKKFEVRLNPGETVYFPSGWWHTAKMQSFSISLGIDVANEYNWPIVLDFMEKKARTKLSFLAPIFMAYIKMAGKSSVGQKK